MTAFQKIMQRRRYGSSVIGLGFQAEPQRNDTLPEAVGPHIQPDYRRLSLFPDTGGGRRVIKKDSQSA